MTINKKLYSEFRCNFSSACSFPIIFMDLSEYIHPSLFHQKLSKKSSRRRRTVNFHQGGTVSEPHDSACAMSRGGCRHWFRRLTWPFLGARIADRSICTSEHFSETSIIVGIPAGYHFSVEHAHPPVLRLKLCGYVTYALCRMGRVKWHMQNHEVRKRCRPDRNYPFFAVWNSFWIIFGAKDSGEYTLRDL